jgi:hypothetical protein
MPSSAKRTAKGTQANPRGLSPRKPWMTSLNPSRRRGMRLPVPTGTTTESGRRDDSASPRSTTMNTQSRAGDPRDPWNHSILICLPAARSERGCLRALLRRLRMTSTSAAAIGSLPQRPNPPALKPGVRRRSGKGYWRRSHRPLENHTACADGAGQSPPRQPLPPRVRFPVSVKRISSGPRLKTQRKRHPLPKPMSTVRS